MTRKTLCLFLPVLFFLGCTSGPRPIEYGADKCDFCRMTIVDPQFAAQLVTSKGRVYKFDAIECMLDMLEQDPEKEYSHVLVCDFSGRGELIAAQSCTYLISRQMPSPMGAFLSAHARKEDAELFQQNNGGDLYSWEELQRHRRQ